MKRLFPYLWLCVSLAGLALPFVVEDFKFRGKLPPAVQAAGYFLVLGLCAAFAAYWCGLQIWRDRRRRSAELASPPVRRPPQS
jgi:hypothetical protein